MKKVIAIIGNQQKNNTYRAVCEFEAQLRIYGEVEVDYIFLKDYRLEFCRGCKVCFNKGEEYCPLRDDRDVLVEKMESADGVIMAAPNYAFHVPAAMKNLLDRLAYVFHRPQFFGKTYTAIVNQGIHGGNAIVKYLSSMGENFGFQVTRGCVLSTMEPVSTAAARKNAVRIRKAAARFYKGLMRPAPPTPTLFRLLMFRLSRTSIQHMLDERSKDFRHYQANGWFEAAYYYPVSLGPVKSLAGHLFDRIGKRIAKRA